MHTDLHICMHHYSEIKETKCDHNIKYLEERMQCHTRSYWWTAWLVSCIHECCDCHQRLKKRQIVYLFTTHIDPATQINHTARDFS